MTLPATVYHLYRVVSQGSNEEPFAFHVDLEMIDPAWTPFSEIVSICLSRREL